MTDMGFDISKPAAAIHSSLFISLSSYVLRFRAHPPTQRLIMLQVAGAIFAFPATRLFSLPTGNRANA
jgi:hypothetical protein